MTCMRSTDLGRLVLLLNDAVIYRNTLSIPFPYTDKDANEFFRQVARFEEINNLQKDWTIRLDGLLIGGIGLLLNHGLESHKSEFGYWLGQPYRGKGIMSQCVNAFVEHVFANSALIRLEAHVFAHNPPSSRLLEKCGFEKEGLVRSAFLKEGKPLDAYLYAKLKPNT